MEPEVVRLVRTGAPLSGLQAVAAKLWFDAGGDDPDGSLKAAVAAYWQAQPGGDPYWDFLSQPMDCDACGDTNRLENLAVCPNCFKTICYKHGRACTCGHSTLG